MTTHTTQTIRERAEGCLNGEDPFIEDLARDVLALADTADAAQNLINDPATKCSHPGNA